VVKIPQVHIGENQVDTENAGALSWTDQLNFIMTSAQIDPLKFNPCYLTDRFLQGPDAELIDMSD
jgi:hypothetical protein